MSTVTTAQWQFDLISLTDSIINTVSPITVAANSSVTCNGLAINAYGNAAVLTFLSGSSVTLPVNGMFHIVVVNTTRGGDRFVIRSGATLTLNNGSVTQISNGAMTIGGTVLLQSSSRLVVSSPTLLLQSEVTTRGMHGDYHTECCMTHSPYSYV
jgi:hypothetical protein